MELPTWWIIGVVVMVVLAILSFTCVFKKALKVRRQVQAALNANVARALAQQGQPQVIVIPQNYAGYEGAPGLGVAPVPVVYMHPGANPALMGHVYPGTDPAAMAHMYPETQMYPGADPAAMGYSYPVAQAYPGTNPTMVPHMYPGAPMYPGADSATTAHGNPGVTMNPGNSPAMFPHAYPGAPMYPGTDPAMMSRMIPPNMATAHGDSDLDPTNGDDTVRRKKILIIKSKATNALASTRL